MRARPPISGEARLFCQSIASEKPKEPLSRITETYAFNQNSERVRRGETVDGGSELQDWFGGRHQIEIKEDVVGLGVYGRTLTVLSAIELPDEEDEDDEETLVERCTPRFRR